MSKKDKMKWRLPRRLFYGGGENAWGLVSQATPEKRNREATQAAQRHITGGPDP
jgi:hypothetical protein